jgi:tight adherence protein B
MNMQALALAFMAFVAVGGLAWVFLYPQLSGEKKAEERRSSITRTEPKARSVDRAQRSKRDQVEMSLKEVEARNKEQSKVPLGTRLTQAGLDWSEQKFLVVSGILGLFAFAMTVLFGGGLLAGAGLAFAAGFGLPRWILGFLKRRRCILESPARCGRCGRPRYQGRPSAIRLTESRRGRRAGAPAQ